MSQSRLLVDRRFRALFATQFLGAFNDNLFKNALVVGIAFRATTLGGLGPQQVVALAAGLFVLPYFLFSAWAGLLSDRLPKTSLMRAAKLAELPIMGLGAAGFLLDDLWVSLAALFLMGLQSTFFGPAKYSVLPELLREDELVAGNALVESGTFLAILLGTIAGGLLAGDAAAIGATALAVAALGYVASRLIPPTPPAAPALRVGLDPVRPMLEVFRAARRTRSVWLSVLGISWFWGLGSALLSLLPSFTRDTIGATEGVVTLFLALFCAGVGLGSLLCERLSAGRLELGLVPVGSIGLSVFALDLWLAGRGWTPGATMGVADFLAAPGSWRVCADLFLIALSGGLYTVPLYTLLQRRAEPDARSRVVAANNVVNALFMVAAAGMLMGLDAAGVSIPATFLVLALLNAVVSAYIYTVLPEFLLRFVVWSLARVMYRLRIAGAEKIPAEGAAVLVANHVSFVDWMLVAAASPRPVRFVMDHSFLKLPLVGFAFRDGGVIPIASAKESRETMERAFDLVAEALAQGDLVCIFPEGFVTRDGRQQVFRPGIERIVARTPAPVVPMAITGMWGSFFSRRGGRAMRRPFRRLWSRVGLVVGDPVPAARVTADGLADVVAALGGWEAAPLPKEAANG